MRILSIALFILIISPPALAYNFRLIETTGDLIQASDFETIEQLQAHKAIRKEASPDSTFKEEDHSAEEALKRAREDKCKNFIFKGVTIAQLRQELNDSMECRK
jgi:hypothetical protein